MSIRSLKASLLPPALRLFPFMPKIFHCFTLFLYELYCFLGFAGVNSKISQRRDRTSPEREILHALQALSISFRRGAYSGVRITLIASGIAVPPRFDLKKQSLHRSHDRRGPCLCLADRNYLQSNIIHFINGYASYLYLEIVLCVS